MPEPCLLRSQLFAQHGMHGIFSLRTGGVSAPPFNSMNLADDTGDDALSVAHNLHTLLAQAGIEGLPHRARQVHGIDVLHCHGSGKMHEDQADILLSDDGSPVAVRIADCTPVLLADTRSDLIAAAHAGWRGSAADAAGHAVKALQAAGASCENILACIGPCIGPCCFEIGEETAEALRSSCVGAGDFIHIRHHRPYADLAAINRLQLQRAGLQADHIEQLVESRHACTCCHAHDFFSYRRHGSASGRHLAIVAPMSTA